MKTYRLGDMPSVEEQDKFGVRHAPKLHIRAIRTGEFRPPVKGEWYLSGARAEAWKTRGNLETPYHILRLVRVENREVIVAMNSSKRRATAMAMSKKRHVRVIFKKFKEGDVIALFPDEPFDNKGHITSYQHHGQHSGASASLLRTLKDASRKEYLPLRDELVSIGYTPVVRRHKRERRRKNPGYKAPLGSGARFKALVKKLESRKGKYKILDAKALAAAIGRKKYGKAAFQKMAARGKWRKRAMGVARRKAANPVIGFGMTLALAGVGAYLLYKYVFKKGSRKPTASAKPTDGKSTADKTRPAGGQRPTDGQRTAGWRRPGYVKPT